MVVAEKRKKKITVDSIRTSRQIKKHAQEQAQYRASIKNTGELAEITEKRSLRQAEKRARNKDAGEAADQYNAKTKGTKAQYQAQYRAKTKESNAQYQAQYRAKTKETNAQYQAYYRDKTKGTNAQYQAQYQAQYRAETKVTYAHYQAQYRAKTKETKAQYQAQYRAKTKGTKVQYQAQYRAKTKGTKAQYQAQYRKQMKEKKAAERNLNTSSNSTNTYNAAHKDALDYMEAIETTMVLYTCAVCGRDEGLINLIKLDNCKEIISRSKIPILFTAKVAPLLNPQSDKYERSWAQQIMDELPGGLLKNAEHVCKRCHKQLPKKKSLKRTIELVESSAQEDDSTLHKSDDESAAIHDHDLVPKEAFINGRFTGKCPIELACLNPTELSMISLINIVCRVSMLSPSANLSTSGTVFSVMNNVNTILESLPQNPTMEQFCIIRSPGDNKTPKDFRYSPYKVIRALKWLDANNRLYENKLQLPSDDSIWKGGIDDEPIDLPFIEATEEDYEGILEFDESENAAEDDGHAVNPGAPSTSTTDILLVDSSPEDQDVETQVRSILTGSNGSGTIVRSKNDFASERDTPYFLQLAFPHLYPWGNGGPEKDGIVFNAAYINDLLNMGGDRRFQQSCTFIFYCYSWTMRQKTGVVAFLGSRYNKDKSADDLTPTVADAKAFLDHVGDKNNMAPPTISITKMRYLLDRMQPFATELPGTSLFFKLEQRRLLSMISSPVTNAKGQWRYFFTEAQADKYLPEIYDNIITSASRVTIHGTAFNASIEDRRSASDKLTEKERAKLLRLHPQLSARIHSLQQKAFWDIILNGKSKPLGHIEDSWQRVEFQMKGTPHSHNLINIRKDEISESSIGSNDPLEVQKVKDLMKGITTASLVDRVEGDLTDLTNYSQAEIPYHLELEKQYDFTIKRSEYFKDMCHPCRQRFEIRKVDKEGNFIIDDEKQYIYKNYELTSDYEFKDSEVQTQFRRLQLANQIHVCRKSCYKYCKRGQPLKCRYGFVIPKNVDNVDNVTITNEKVNYNHVRTRVNPTRNNGHLNACARNPLLFIASRGNQDIQYIENKTGGAIYTSKYASKADTPESKALQNAISRKIAQQTLLLPPHTSLTFAAAMRAVLNAMVQSLVIGTVQACYILSQFKLVTSSRKGINLNTLIRKDVTTHNIIVDKPTLDEMNDQDSAFNNSPNTQFGRRDAYYALYKQQKEKYNSVTFNFHAFISSYKVRKQTPNDKKGVTKIKNEDTLHQLLVDEDGFITNAETFTIGEVYYKVCEKLQIITLTPHIRVIENTEKSAYSILLLHSDWGDGEEHLLAGRQTAVERLEEIRESLPEYVKRSLQRRRENEELQATSGNPDINATAATIEEFDQLFYENNVNNDKGTFAGNKYEGVEQSEFNLDFRQVAKHGMVIEVPKSHCAYFDNYVSNQISKLKENYQKANTFNEHDKMAKEADPNCIIKVDNHEQLYEDLQRQVKELNDGQLVAYVQAKYHISGDNTNPLTMFLTGQGGTGKSKVIDVITNYTRLLYGKQAGVYGAVAKTAATGGAAYNIKGSTWHSTLGKSDTDSKIKNPSPDGCLNLQRKLKGVKLFILDEISLCSLENLHEISTRLCIATGKHDKPFGGVHTILAGDFYQMKTMNGTPIVEAAENWSAFKKSQNPQAVAAREIFINQLSHFCELTTNVRAKQTNGKLSDLAKFNAKARLGDVGPGVLEIMNTRVVNTIQSAMKQAHKAAIWITSTHQKIAEINEAFAKEMLKEEGAVQIRVIADHIPYKVGTPMPDERTRDELYNVQGDPKGAKFQPRLTHMDLMVGTRIRLIDNISVEMGLYNGAMGTIVGFVYHGKGPQTPEERMPSNFSKLEIEDREQPIIMVQMDGVDDKDFPNDPTKSSFPFSCTNKMNRVIPISPSAGTYKIKSKYERVMYPFLVAFARTAHSVQGYTAENGIVVDVGSNFFAGDYVAISRAKFLEQILLLGAVRAKYFTSHALFRVQIEDEYKRLRKLNNNLVE